MKYLATLIFAVAAVVGRNAFADDGLNREQALRCMGLGSDIMRAEENMEIGERTIRNIKRRFMETTNRNFQRELERDYNKIVRKQNRRIENYEDFLLPRFNKECARKAISQPNYNRVCNTRDRLENLFCKSFSDFARDMKRQKGWK